MTKKIVSLVLGGIMLLSMLFSVSAAESYDETAALPSGEGDAIATATDYKTAKKISETFDTVEFGVEIDDEGEYALELCYCIPEEVESDVHFSVYVDGTVWLESIEIKPYWKDSDSGIRTDLFGDEYAPEQVRFSGEVTAVLTNKSSPLNSIYYTSFSKGFHKIKFSNFSQNVTISKLNILKMEVAETFAHVSENILSREYDLSEVEQFDIQGEAAYIKSEKSLVSKSNTSSPLLTPSDAYIQRINYIGGTGWTSLGEEIVWKINIPKTGFYKFGFTFLQDQNINGFSYRELKIDGRIPYADCAAVAFKYSTGWQSAVLSSYGKELFFFLEEGEHELSLTATLGETAVYYAALEDLMTVIGDLYIDIAMITGETPDANRDYELFRNIPNFNDRLTEIGNSLQSIADGLLSISNNGTTSLISALKDMKRIVDTMVKEKYSAQKYVSNYQSSYTTLSNWLYDMRSMPLSLDKISVIPYDKEAQFKTVSFGKRLIYGIKRFLLAFNDDYVTPNDDDGESIKIWVNWGRDQAMVLSTLISENFTPKTGIKVNLELTNASLLYGMMSGIAPDLSLHMARTEPVNLALRGALVDLSKFDDYEEAASNFGESADVPYRYNGGIYALPDQQSFYIMFYRKDILNKLGIPVPNTWDEFLTAVSVLQRNNMNAWIPYTQISSATTVNTGIGGLNMYATILQQFGGSVYSNKLNTCVINNTIGLNAFTYWTDMYTKFTLPTTASFYNRFRTGTMPLGIEAYTLYTTLLEAAPDINGRWGIALVPGIEDENGNINRTVAGSGTGCGILKTSKNQDAAWEFLKWWTSAETQIAYNNNIEAILGTVSRVTTSNIEAFSKMEWNDDDLSVLLEQRSYIEEIPEVPGSYYVARSIDQAFWNVVNNATRPKDAIDKWSRVSTEEIERKISEYSK